MLIGKMFGLKQRDRIGFRAVRDDCGLFSGLRLARFVLSC